MNVYHKLHTWCLRINLRRSTWSWWLSSTGVVCLRCQIHVMLIWYDFARISNVHCRQDFPKLRIGTTWFVIFSCKFSLFFLECACFDIAGIRFLSVVNRCVPFMNSSFRFASCHSVVDRTIRWRIVTPAGRAFLLVRVLASVNDMRMVRIHCIRWLYVQEWILEWCHSRILGKPRPERYNQMRPSSPGDFVLRILSVLLQDWDSVSDLVTWAARGDRTMTLQFGCCEGVLWNKMWDLLFFPSVKYTECSKHWQ